MPEDLPVESELVGALERLEEHPVHSYPAEVQVRFAEIHAALRVPYEGPLYRLLAKDPPLLAAVWAILEPALRTRYAERETRRLIEHTLPIAPHPELGVAHLSGLERRGFGAADREAIRALHATLQYAFAKQLLAAAAVLLLLDGDPRPPGRLSDAERELLPLGVAPRAAAADPLARDSTPLPVQALLEQLRDAHGLPFVPGYFHCLARFPGYLEQSIEELRPLVGTERFRSAARTLTTLAAVGAARLPQSGALSVDGALPRSVARALIGFLAERLLPELMLDVSWLRALAEGTAAARENPLAIA